MAMLNNQMVLESWNRIPPWSSWSSNPPWSEDGKIAMVSGEDFPNKTKPLIRAMSDGMMSWYGDPYLPLNWLVDHHYPNFWTAILGYTPF